MDVFASADEVSMDRVLDDRTPRRGPLVLVSNTMAVIVHPDASGDVRSVEDLEDERLVVALCNERCPAGRYAASVADALGLRVVADSLEADVMSVASRVLLGEADAGIVYETDRMLLGDQVISVPIPIQAQVHVRYPIASFSREGDAFLDLLLSSEAGDVFRRYGFGPP